MSLSAISDNYGQTDKAYDKTFVNTLKGRKRTIKHQPKLKLAKKIAAAKAPAQLTQKQEDLILEYRIRARKVARTILRRWRARLDMAELDSSVDLALCEAALRFNPKRGVSFMTFLFYYLYGVLVRAVQDSAENGNLTASSIEISDFAAGQELGVTKNGVHRTVNSNDIVDAVIGQSSELPEDTFYRSEISNITQKVCSNLSDFQKELVQRLYGADQTTVEIAKELGYSRCHVSRLKRKTLEKLYKELTWRVEEFKDKEPYFLKDDGEGAVNNTKSNVVKLTTIKKKLRKLKHKQMALAA